MPKKPEPTNPKDRTIRRLRSYWKLESANIFAIPGIVFFILFQSGQYEVGVPLILNLLATSWMLVVGTFALRMMYLNALGDRSFEQKWIGRLNQWKLPSLLVILVAVASTIWLSFRTLPSVSINWLLCLSLTLLASAEYVNYYHFQLQHFDNVTDFQRLLAGKGFRKSHLARAIERWKSGGNKVT